MRHHSHRLHRLHRLHRSPLGAALAALAVLAVLTLFSAWGVARPAAAQATPATPAVGAEPLAPAAAIAVSADGTRAVTIGPDGAAWVYEFKGGKATRSATLKPKESAFNGFRALPGALAIRGTTIAIGAPDEAKGGAVYIFTYKDNAWAEVERIADDNGDQQFGRALALSDDTLAVTTLDTAGKPVVQLYGLQKDGWFQQDRLSVTEKDPVPGEAFGTALAVEGDYLLVGTDRGPDRAGAAYVFLRTSGSWSQQARLIPEDSAVGDRFGVRVALSGRTAVISAEGAAYILSRGDTGWAQRQKLAAAADEKNFAAAVAIYEPTVLIGYAGGGIIYDRQGSTTWSLVTTFPGPEGNTAFGRSVAVAKDLALFAMPGNSADPSGALTAYTRQAGKWGAAQVTPIK